MIPAMLTATASKQQNDCVVVAISTAEKLDYDVVYQSLQGFKSDGALIGKNGITSDVWHSYIKSLGYIKCKSIPRRGQEKVSGIVRLISSKYAVGHLVYMQNGMVFDSFHPLGIHIKEYQARYRKSHINEIWIKVSLDIPVTKPQDDNWLSRLQFS